MNITINNTTLEFRFRFKELKALLKAIDKDLADLESWKKSFDDISLIGSIGTGKTIEEIEDLLNEDSFEGVKQITTAFNEEVLQYFNPNSLGQTN